MKNAFLIVTALLLIIGCSPDSSDNSGDASAYLSLKAGNYWKYDISGASFSGTDSLYIATDTTISGKTYKKFKTRNQPIGFFSNTVSNNSVRIDGGKILLSGTAGTMLGFALPVDLLISDFIVFKDKTSEGDVLDTFQDQVHQTVEGLPLDIDYELRTVSGPTFESYTNPEGTVYEDVRSVKTYVQLKITTTLEVIPGFPQTILILDTQNVISSQQFYAKGKGVVHTSTTVQYELEEFPVEFDLPFPRSYSDSHYEILTDYHMGQ